MRETLEKATRRVEIATPLVRGGRSRMLSMADVEAVRRLIPHAGFVNVENADHMVAGHAHEAFQASGRVPARGLEA